MEGKDTELWQMTGKWEAVAENQKRDQAVAQPILTLIKLWQILTNVNSI